MEQILPPGFRSDFVNTNGVKLHVVHNGEVFNGKPLNDGRLAIMMLHGFPEFWIAWENVMRELGDDYLIIAPDQRGYNLSDAPAGVENYRAKLLVQDMVGLSSALLGEKHFALAGHDWGASIAYALAINFPEQINHLFIANGVHPACFQQAIIDYPAQAKASAYFHILRREDASRFMVENDFKRTFSMFEGFSKTPWLTEEIKDRYRVAWADKARLQAMLHWYNSSPIEIPKEGETLTDTPLYNVGYDKFRVTMPHTLIWGAGDQALLPVCHEKLEHFCDSLQKISIPEGDHWLLHTHAEEIAAVIKKAI